MRGSMILAACALGLGLSASPSFGRPRAAHGGAIVGEEARVRIAAEGKARVIVFLDDGGVSLQPSKSLAERSRAAVESQEMVLRALEPGELLVARRFSTVPALAGTLTAEGLRKLEGIRSVLRVDLDEGGSGSLAEAVPLTNSDDVQALGYTGQGITVAILDSGVDRDHPDLADSLQGEACFCGGGCCPNGLNTQFGPGAAEDDHGHGSNVAGIVTSNGIVSPRGVAPGAGIIAVKVLDASNHFCCTSDIVAGLDWVNASGLGARVVNMSLGTFALYPGACDNADAGTLSLANAINQLRFHGVVSFASSGNNASGTQMGAPACIANALSVGAVYDSNIGSVSYGICSDPTTAADKVTCFTNTNGTTDMFAPGAPITSDYLGGGTSTFFGTSQASPHAAGCAADLLQAADTLDPSSLEAVLESTGHPVVDTTNGLSFPRIDCLAALNAAVAPSGRVPEVDSVDEQALHIMRAGGEILTLTWGASCSPTDTEYGVYEGAMGDFTSHLPLYCTTNGLTTITVPSGPGSHYYLITPRNLTREGSFGRRSDGSERPPGPSPCLPQLLSVCE